MQIIIHIKKLDLSLAPRDSLATCKADPAFPCPFSINAGSTMIHFCQDNIQLRILCYLIIVYQKTCVRLFSNQIIYLNFTFIFCLFEYDNLFFRHKSPQVVLTHTFIRTGPMVSSFVMMLQLFKGWKKQEKRCRVICLFIYTFLCDF